MANSVRVEFLGLMGVVPNREQPEASPDSYLIALPDLEYGLRDPRLPKYEDQETGDTATLVPPHVAAVIVPTDSVVSESRKRPAMQFRSCEGVFAGRDYSLYPIRGESLELAPLAASSLDAPYRRISPGAHVPHDAEDACGLQWIPQLGLANANGARNVGKFARERFLNPDWTPRARENEQLAGTVLIRHGRFCVQDVIREDGRPVEFEFMVPTRTLIEWKQARYAGMVWDSAVEGGRLDLVFRGSSPDGPGMVSLRAIDGRCDVWVANLELTALLGVGCMTPRATRADLDFSVLYLYGTDVPDTGQGMPVPHDPEKVGSSSPRCGSSMFDE